MSEFNREATIADIIEREWQMFQATTNQGGRASCQNNKPMFMLMRCSQFAAWSNALLEQVRVDLMNAASEGRNLITEKYAWMMQSTDPEYFHRELEAYLPKRTAEQIALQEQIIATQLKWAEQFHAQYPHLGEHMRVLHTAQDTREITSFETYLRGELSTYSLELLQRYATFIQDNSANNKNLTEQIMSITVTQAGYANLEEAEQSQA